MYLYKLLDHIIERPGQFVCNMLFYHYALLGLVIPWCQDCGTDALLQAVAAVGAIIMPHNLYLHSALVKTRQYGCRNLIYCAAKITYFSVFRIDRSDKKSVAEANKYFMIEGSIALFVSFILNLFVIGVFGNGLYNVTYQQAFDNCNNTDSIYTDSFINQDGP